MNIPAERERERNTQPARGPARPLCAGNGQCFAGVGCAWQSVPQCVASSSDAAVCAARRWSFFCSFLCCSCSCWAGLRCHLALRQDWLIGVEAPSAEWAGAATPSLLAPPSAAHEALAIYPGAWQNSRICSVACLRTHTEDTVCCSWGKLADHRHFATGDASHPQRPLRDTCWGLQRLMRFWREQATVKVRLRQGRWLCHGGNNGAYAAPMAA